MKEVWVKKTIYRRYLIDDEDVDAVKATLEFDNNGVDLLGNCYDNNENIEYDNEELFLPIQFEVKEI